MTEINSVGAKHNEISNKKAPQKVKHEVNESLFLKLDKNKDGKITEDELTAHGYNGKDLIAMEEALYKSERTVNKWFAFDKNKDGRANSVEMRMWNLKNTDNAQKFGEMSPEEFAKEFDLKEKPTKLNFEKWCQEWMNDEDPMASIKSSVKAKYGKVLTEEETQLLYDAMKNQANRWLFKDDALYNRLNTTAYTRLITSDQIVSCCGGDVSKPPMDLQPTINANGEVESNSCSKIFSSMTEDNSVNYSDEIKNRLAWAAFPTVSQREAAEMTPEEYAKYKADWEAVRNMKASDYRKLLLPENKAELEKFEAKSNMTVKQIVDYIDIVESTTGKPFDAFFWTVNLNEFVEIGEKVNGNYGDDRILEGKTRNDVPPERQELLKYLEKHNLLFDQFKE